MKKAGAEAAKRNQQMTSVQTYGSRRLVTVISSILVTALALLVIVGVIFIIRYFYQEDRPDYVKIDYTLKTENITVDFLPTGASIADCTFSPEAEVIVGDAVYVIGNITRCEKTSGSAGTSFEFQLSSEIGVKESGGYSVGGVRIAVGEQVVCRYTVLYQGQAYAFTAVSAVTAMRSHDTETGETL